METIRRDIRPILDRYRIRIIEVAEVIKSAPSTASRKTSGKTKLSLDEAFAIWDLVLCFDPTVDFFDIFPKGNA